MVLRSTTVKEKAEKPKGVEKTHIIYSTQRSNANNSSSLVLRPSLSQSASLRPLRSIIHIVSVSSLLPPCPLFLSPRTPIFLWGVFFFLSREKDNAISEPESGRSLFQLGLFVRTEKTAAPKLLFCFLNKSKNQNNTNGKEMNMEMQSGKKKCQRPPFLFSQRLSVSILRESGTQSHRTPLSKERKERSVGVSINSTSSFLEERKKRLCILGTSDVFFSFE